MAEESDLNASIAHLVLAVLGGHNVSKLHPKCFSHPGMQGNYFIHGIIGVLHYQSKYLPLYRNTGRERGRN